MDLLKGYGSDDSSSSSDTDAGNAKASTTAPTAAAAPSRPKTNSILKAPKYQTQVPPKPSSSSRSKPNASAKTNALGPIKSETIPKAKRPGKRILSLGAVLPPEIFDRLTRGPQEGSSDESSVSSSQEGGGGGSGGKTRKRRRPTTRDNNSSESPDKASVSGAGDKSELNSLLSELRSTPLHVKSATKNANSSALSLKPKDETKKGDNKKLGMAFMSFTSSTTTSKKKSDVQVVDIHSSTAAPSSMQQVEDVESEDEDNETNASTAAAALTGKSLVGKVAPKATTPSISFSRMSGAAPIASSFTSRNEPSFEQPAYLTMQNNQPETVSNSNTYNDNSYPKNNNNNHNPAGKSRKQKRDEERALRSGQAFHDPLSSANTAHATTELYQPSPEEFAPSAHAAAIASRAARYRGLGNLGGGGGGGGDGEEGGNGSGGGGGGKGAFSNIAMYDPQSGTDVKGVGVTAKHKSKHQINQLMASAMSLEAHRAADAELARFGVGGSGTGGGSSNRADAKRKYGW